MLKMNGMPRATGKVLASIQHHYPTGMDNTIYRQLENVEVEWHSVQWGIKWQSLFWVGVQKYPPIGPEHVSLCAVGV